ncbi:MAG: glycosyltransferase, partial [Flavobacteriales bacterium]|nr:glycosyltransferase [Flavobacteriales bacterium]
MVSILGQTFTDFEFLIINDGSTDASESIIRSFNDPRIRYVRNEKNLRLIATLNRGFDLATGKYIARMDADDIAVEERLRKQVDFLEANPLIGAVGSWIHTFDHADSVTRYPFSDVDNRYMSLHQCSFCHPTLLLRTSVIKDNHLTFSADYPRAEDYEFWLRLIDHCQTANLQEVLLNYRSHDSNISKLETTTQIKNSLIIRGMFFKKAGVDCDEKELDLYRRMKYHGNAFTETQLDRLTDLLNRLLEGNKQTRYIDSVEMQKKLSVQWFQLCNNHSHHGISIWRR